MTEKKTHTRLGLVLLGATLLSFAVATGTFFLTRTAANALIKEQFFTPERVRQSEYELLTEFSDYVHENEISVHDTDGIQSWVSMHPDTMLFVYDLTTRNSSYSVYSGVGGENASYTFLQEADSSYINYFSMRFPSAGDQVYGITPMRERTVGILYYPIARYSRAAVWCCAGLSFLVFTALLLTMIHKKTGYIVQLSRELTVMQGGDLTHPVTVRGKDELTSLARDIDDMRLSFIERLESETAMRQANSQLVTAMSHDLRTPLTALMGYLDILDLNKTGNEEEARKYIASSRRKAYQIKEMTDKLFEYALVYSNDEPAENAESMDAATAVTQFIAESGMILETDGFTIELQQPEASIPVDIAVSEMRRVYDNIFSNIRKYADRSVPIRITMQCKSDTFTVVFENKVGEKNESAESSGIGVKTCVKIMEKHRGAFRAEQDGDLYRTTVTYQKTRG